MKTHSSTHPSIVAAALLLLAAPGPAWAEEKGPPKGLEIGAAAPDFDLPGVDGKSHRLADFAGAELLLIVFTCNHCPTAQAYEARLIKLAAEYKDRGVAFVAISPNDPEAVRLDELGYTDLGDSLEEMKIRAKDAGFDFPYLYDGEKQLVSRAYGAKATPQVFLFDRDRKLRYSGRIDDNESGKAIKRHDAREALEALLAGKPVAEPTTRSFGCSVKWSDKREDNKRFLEKLAKEPVSIARIDAAAAKALRENKTDKVRLINVWATWCGPCVAEFPELVTAHRMYRHRKVEVITISFDSLEKEADVLSSLKKHQASTLNHLYGAENRDALADALSKTWSGSLPFTILIAPGGKVLFEKEGQIDALELRRKIVGEIGRTY
jgi:peroxiredoxin